MAISPTVQAYMQDAEGKAPSSAEQMFIKRFADQAFNTLRAKNPEIINLVVTFKVLESDIDKASAMGVFALQVGKDIRYLPVILSRGSLTSCEMIYNKTEDQLMPLTDKFSRDLLAANHLSDATVLNRSPRVEDTRTLFRDMVRPPASSNVILAASSEGVAALPGKAKEALAEYFEAHPELLAKIADFYAVEELAEKLAYRGEVMPAINPTPTVVRVEDLTKAAAHFLTREEQTIMLADGYIVKKAADSTVLVAPLDSLSQEAETTLRIEAYTGNKGLLSQVLLANALCCTPEGFHREPVLTLGNAVLSIQGKRTDADERAVLLEQASPRVTSENLRRFGAVPGGKELLDLLKKEGARGGSVLVLCPTRAGGFCVAGTVGQLVSKASHYSVRCVEDEVYVDIDPFPGMNAGKSTQDGTLQQGIRVTGTIRYGFLKTSYGLAVPKESYFIFLPVDQECIPYTLSTLDELRKVLVAVGTKLTTTADGVTISITDTKREKTASFACRADAAEWLAERFSMSGTQIKTALDHRDTLVFRKTAFTPYPDPRESPASSMPLSPPVFQPEHLEAYSTMEDPELLDTGMLASFAQDPDIKTLLVDYLPDFLRVLDRIGRVILLLAAQEEDMEAFYGREKHAEVLANCRKVFRLVGNLVDDLKSYVNMA